MFENEFGAAGLLRVCTRHASVPLSEVSWGSEFACVIHNFALSSKFPRTNRWLPTAEGS